MTANQQIQSMEKYLLLFDSAFEGLFQCDQQGRILLINRAGTQILGFKDPKEIINKTIQQLGIQVDAEQNKNISEDIQKNQFIKNRLLTIQLPNKEKKQIELTVHGDTDDKGQTAGYEGLFRDVTKKVAMEEELRNYSTNLENKIQEKTREVLELERSKFHLEKLASLGQMAAMIVHDMRNPLSSIKMGLTTLLNRAELIERDRYCVELSVREVEHLERILKDLLNFAKPQDLQFSENDINQVISKALDQVAEHFKDDDVSIERKLDPDLPPVRMDRDRLSQVFSNLILNARQAIKNTGTILIESKMNSEIKQVLVVIQDDGEGIKPENIDHIFDPFFSTKAEGTGLGLSVVKKLIDAHNGTIKVDSDEGKGTCVTVQLPFEKSSQQHNQ